MLVLTKLPPADWRDGKPVVATLGNFDGLHRGHMTIMRTVISRARALNGLATVITFDPHPQRVLFPDRAPHLMQTADQKTRLLAAAGLDATIIVPFDRTLATLTAEQFVREILIERVGITEVHIGPDFRFGAQRAGDVALLSRLGAELGFTAHAAEAVHDRGERISASLIRRLLTAGQVDEARTLLGRPFSLVGTIVHGEGRGKRQLVPTANLAPENEFMPATGVYITRFRGRGAPIPGVTNVGVRPTFGDRRLTVETYLPGFDGQLYGQRIELDFLQRLRAEQKFDSPELLLAQIKQDLAVFERFVAESKHLD